MRAAGLGKTFGKTLTEVVHRGESLQKFLHPRRQTIVRGGGTCPERVTTVFGYDLTMQDGKAWRRRAERHI